jgi:hypothetical protein
VRRRRRAGAATIAAERVWQTGEREVKTLRIDWTALVECLAGSTILVIPTQILRRAAECGQPLGAALGQVELLLLLVVTVEIIFVRSRRPPA